MITLILYRCIVCNKTSSPLIATNLGDDTSTHFVLDKQSETGFICADCEQWDFYNRQYFENKDRWEAEEELELLSYWLIEDSEDYSDLTEKHVEIEDEETRIN